MSKKTIVEGAVVSPVLIEAASNLARARKSAAEATGGAAISYAAFAVTLDAALPKGWANLAGNDVSPAGKQVATHRDAFYADCKTVGDSATKKMYQAWNYIKGYSADIASNPNANKKQGFDAFALKTIQALFMRSLREKELTKTGTALVDVLEEALKDVFKIDPAKLTAK